MSRPALKNKAVALLIAGFVAVVLLFLFQIKSEWGQILFMYCAAFGFGYYLGHREPGSSLAKYGLYGAAVGVLTWAGAVVASFVFYPDAADYPLWAWFVRFAIGGGLLLTGGAILGDAAARQKLSMTSTVFGGLVSLLGVIVAIVKPGG